MNDLITLDQLRVLDAIDRRGSFAAAAEELHRVTSAVSYAVRALEEALGLALFDRAGHRAALTPAGRRILDEGRLLLERARELDQLARDLRGEWEATLTVVADGVLPMPPLMRAFRRLEARGVPTRVQLAVEYLGGVRERFERERADLMMVLDFAGDELHIAEPLPPLEMILVARRDHPVHAGGHAGGHAGRRVDRADLAAHVELTVSDSRRDGAPPLGRLSLGSSQLFRLSDFHSKREALLEGVGLGWMPRDLIARDLARGTLRPIDFREGPRHVFHPHIVRRRGVPLGRAARALYDEILEEPGGTKARAAKKKPRRRPKD
ncbi:Transcriptional regulator, LysR family protein [Minicystis rosea]|nr:Transcriptional regulator, LysR family protein [Minicystis rosea]